jgi:hypothetical protein
MYNNIMPFTSWFSIASLLPQDRGVEAYGGATQNRNVK